MVISLAHSPSMPYQMFISTESGQSPARQMETHYRSISPRRFNINNAINPQLCSLSYITVNEVAAKAIELGKGSHRSVIAKIDISQLIA